jgi:hypothetical protein
MAKTAKEFGPIAVTLAMLAALAGFARLNIATEGVAEFRARSRVAVDALPMTLGDWRAERRPIDAGAKDLLKPNAEATLLYQNPRTGAEAFYSIVQVRDSRNMVGHTPAVCYPNNGWRITRRAQRTWRVGEFEIPGVEYDVERIYQNQEQRWTLRNFYIFPDGRVGATPDELNRAAEDYRRLAYGAAQVQVVTGTAMTERARDEVFQALVGSQKSLEMIRVLRAGIPK